VPIEESANSTREQLQSLGFEVSNFCFENIQARDRSARVLSAIASSVGGVFTCNANKSEMTVGYTTLYGDLGGFFAPLADVWKTDVYKLANYINEIDGDYVIPSGSITVKPSAELSEKQDVTKGLGDPLIYEYHDLLFKSWVERWSRATPADILRWTLDRRLEENLGCEFDIVVKHFNGDISLFIEDLEKWWNLFDGFAFAKRIQAPPVLATSKRSYGFDLRESQTAPFYSKRYFDLKNELLFETSKEQRIKTILNKLLKEDITALKDYWKVI
jgi:NAD+ synthase (glutamine-hydrolysing)